MAKYKQKAFRVKKETWEKIKHIMNIYDLNKNDTMNKLIEDTYDNVIK